MRCVFDGPINGERFLAHVEQFPVPTLKPGDIVILDNPGSHKGKNVRRAIRAAGAKLFLLPISDRVRGGIVPVLPPRPEWIHELWARMTSIGYGKDDQLYNWYRHFESPS